MSGERRDKRPSRHGANAPGSVQAARQAVIDRKREEALERLEAKIDLVDKAITRKMMDGYEPTEEQARRDRLLARARRLRVMSRQEPMSGDKAWQAEYMRQWRQRKKGEGWQGRHYCTRCGSFAIAWKMVAPQADEEAAQ